MIRNRWRLVLGLLLVLPLFPAQTATANEISRGQETVAQLDPPMPAASAVAVVPPLTATPWRLAELIGEPWPSEQDPPYLLFTKAGDLLGFGGCNYFIGKYRRDADEKLLISSLRATHKLCPEGSEPETTLLTSLVLANSLQAGDEELTFSLNGTPLLKLAQAPDLDVDELLRQGKLLTAKKTRAHKARSKKEITAAKTKKTAKKHRN